MKISEATLADLGDKVATGAKNVKNAVQSGETSFGAGGGTLGALLDPNRIASGITTKDQMAQNNFVQDFTSKAIQAIQNGIQGNYIDPNLAMSKDPLTPAPDTSQPADSNNQPQQTTKPEAPQAPQATTKPQAQQATTKPQAPQQKAEPAQEPLTFGREKYTKGPKGWIDSKGKPADPNVAKILDKASAQAGTSPASSPAPTPAPSAAAPAAAPAAAQSAAKPAKPQAGKSTVPQGGGKVPGYQSMSPGAQRKRDVRAATKPAAPAPAAAPKRQSFSAKIAPQLQNQVLRRQAAKGNQPVRESNYEKLNAIFESYYKLLEAGETETQEMISIPDYIGKQFLPDYLKGIPYNKVAPQITALLKAMEKNPKPTKELAAIAKLAWALVPKSGAKEPEDTKQAGAGANAVPTIKPEKGKERQGTDWGDLGKNL